MGRALLTGLFCAPFGACPSNPRATPKATQIPCLFGTYGTSLAVDPGDCEPQSPSRISRIRPRTVMTAHTFGFFGRALGVLRLGSGKRNMRAASNKLWTFILALTLVAGGTVSLPGHVRADYAPGETAPPPTPGPDEGDPDYPNGKSLMPRPGPTRGAAGPGLRTNASERMGWSAKWMWSIRVAASTVYRIFFRS